MDITYKSLSSLINNKNIVILAADKENKINNMINEESLKKNIETVDVTYKDLKRFQDFFYRNLYKHEQYGICDQNQINQVGFSLQLKLTSLTLSMIQL